MIKKEKYYVITECRFGGQDRKVDGQPLELTAREAKYLLLEGKISKKKPTGKKESN